MDEAKTRGKLRNKQTGFEIPGERIQREYFSRWHEYVDFAIEGSSISNAFRVDEWDFIPDPKPLPTKQGAIIRAKVNGETMTLARTDPGSAQAWFRIDRSYTFLRKVWFADTDIDLSTVEVGTVTFQ